MADDQETQQQDEQPLIPAHIADANAVALPFPAAQPASAPVMPAVHPMAPVEVNIPFTPATTTHAATIPAMQPEKQAPLVPSTLPLPSSQPASTSIMGRPAPSGKPFNPAEPISAEQAEEKTNPFVGLLAKEKGIKNPFLRRLAEFGTIGAEGGEGLSRNYPQIAATREAAAARLQQQPLAWATEEARAQNDTFNQQAKERGLADTENKNANEAAYQQGELANEAKKAPNKTPQEKAYDDLMTGGSSGGPRINGATGKPYTSTEALQATQKPTEPHQVAGIMNGKPVFGFLDQNGDWWSKPNGQGEKLSGFSPTPSYVQGILPTKTQSLMGPDGLVHNYAWNKETGRYDIDQGVSGTGAYGHEMEQAGAVNRAGTQLIADIEANKASLGTLGAWVEKYGLNTPIADPQLAGLQAELSTFAALQPAMHGFRSHSALEAFDKIIGGLQKYPDATIASIRGILKTAGEINPNLGAAPAKGNVEDGYRFKGGDPSKQSNWEKVE